MSAAVLSVAVDAAAPQALPEVRKRKPSKYKGKPKRGPVNVQRFLEDGVERVRVPLFGRGHGTSVVLDAANWDDGRDNQGWPECWTLGGAPNGQGHVVTGRKTVSGRAQQPRSRTPLAAMGRLIMDAQPGEAVRYLDGNTCNLRRANLIKLDREAAKKWRSEMLAKLRSEKKLAAGVIH